MPEHGLDDLHRASDQMTSWLVNSAAPLWEAVGIDQRLGGFFEEIVHGPGVAAPQGAGALRRGRVVARQIYAFEIARRLGWQAHGSDPLEHGAQYLFSRLRGEKGLFLTAVAAESHEGRGSFSLYEHAFYLFALAQIDRRSSVLGANQMALRCLQSLRREFGRRQGGFEESSPPGATLQSNPHMHLLEAALAWLDVPAAGSEWEVLARELVLLCLDRFIDPSTGALPELFDSDWRPLSAKASAIIEPGHQFEWAWLLLRWCALPHSTPEERQRCRSAAARLIEIGETGVDPIRGVAINELGAELTPKDLNAKIWPQTERIKAWCAVLRDGTAVDPPTAASGNILKAVQVMSGFFLTDIPGLWHEVLLANGGFLRGPTKASSLYHIVGAIDDLHTTVRESRAR